MSTVATAFDFNTLHYEGELELDAEHNALTMNDIEGPERFSVNLDCYGLRPAPGRVFIKDYSEHEGLAAALESAGLVRIEKTVTFGPYKTRAHEVTVLIPA